VQGASDPISALAKAASQGIAGTASSGSATASSSAGASQPAATDQSTTDGTNESTTDAATPSPADTSDQPPANGSTASATPATSDPKPKVDPSWVHFKFNQMDIKKSTSSSADASMYSASYSTIFASASVGHSNSTQIQAVSNDDKSFELSFDLKLVSVFRPWMDMTIFRNNSWVIGRKIWSNEGPISYGNKDDIKDINPEPLMPVVITNIILARNISLKGTDLHIQDQAIQAASESHASANYFGFNMSGAKSHSSSTTDESKQGHITELRSDGVQIIGCVSTILPECPSK
jgi:hypothetical protein